MMLLTALAFLSTVNAFRSVSEEKSLRETVVDRLEHILAARTARDVQTTSAREARDVEYLRGKPARPVCRKTQTLKDGGYHFQMSWRTDLAEVLFYKTSGVQDFNGEGYIHDKNRGVLERAGDKIWDYCHACLHQQKNYQKDNDINDYDYREFGEDYCAFSGTDAEFLESVGELEDGCFYVNDARKESWMREGLIYDPEDMRYFDGTTCPDLCTDYTSCSSCLENPDDACVWDTEGCIYVNRRNFEYYEAGWDAERFGWPGFVDSASQC